MLNTLIVRDRQNLLDIAVQESGTAEAVFEVALLNGLAVTDELQVGQELKKPAVVDAAVVAIFIKENRHPATGITIILGDDGEEIMLEGIGYWIIEDDNVVQ